jgi:hypothetical protein
MDEKQMRALLAIGSGIWNHSFGKLNFSNNTTTPLPRTTTTIVLLSIHFFDIFVIRKRHATTATMSTSDIETVRDLHSVCFLFIPSYNCPMKIPFSFLSTVCCIEVKSTFMIILYTVYIIIYTIIYNENNIFR